MAAPVLRNLLQSQVKKMLTLSIAFSFAGGAAWMFGVNYPRQAKYAAFYENYDAEAEATKHRAELAALGKL